MGMISKGERPVPQDLGAMLRKAIRESGLTRNALSELSGVRYAPLWRFLSNEDFDLRLKTASRLLAALGLHVEFRKTKQGKSRKVR